MARRSLLVLISCALVALALVPGPAGAASSFPQGVASYATHNTALLWTRYPKGGPVKYQVSTRRNFSKITKKGRTGADADNDYTATVEVTGLKPARKYFFRFRVGDAQTKGRFKTLPAPTAPAAFDFSVSGDSDKFWTAHPQKQDEPFQLLRRVKETKPDFFVYLGDTIYSDSEAAAEKDIPIALTIEEKWAKYRLNRLPATKALLKSTSTWAQWDDHEVINDYDGAVLAQTDPALLQAGQAAFFDYFPIPMGPTYRKIEVGSNADFFLLDERTYRTQSADELTSPCRDEEGVLDPAPTLPEQDRAFYLQVGPVDPDCLAHIFDPTRTMLGAEQKQWLKDNLLESDATWKFIINEVPIIQLYAIPYDRWEGYHAERDELLRFIRDNNIENVVFLTTDIHANWASPVLLDTANSDNRRGIAYEVTSGPIQTCYLECEFDGIQGEGATDAFFNAFDIRGLVVMDCVNYKVYAYSTVRVPRDPTGSLDLEWRGIQKAKTGGGKIIPDLNDEGEGCVETLAPGVYPE